MSFTACRGVSAAQQPFDLAVEIADAENVTVTLTNRGNSAVAILIWGSPFEQHLSQDVFDIRSVESAQRADFVGRYIKRGTPQPEDFIGLAPGESLAGVVPLVRYYALPALTEYSISLGWNLQYRVAESNHSVWLNSVPVQAVLVPQPEVIPALGASFQSCSVQQQSQLQTSVQEAEQMVIAARDGLAGLTGDARYNSPRYKQWFGRYDAERFDLVLDTYSNLSDVLATESIGFRCDCDEAGFFAFVYASDPFNMTLCPAFWTAPLVGRDSKAGTIVHELTHFPVVQGTKDYAYSFNVIALARDEPEKAVRNADNFEYFAENAPDIVLFNGVVFTEIEPDTEIFGSLAVGQSSFYKVSGVNIVEVLSFSGNADLAVYETAANDVEFCTSRSTGDIDRCLTPDLNTTYIGITASSTVETRYRLVAQNNPSVVVQSGDQGGTNDKARIGSIGFWLLVMLGGLLSIKRLQNGLRD